MFGKDNLKELREALAAVDCDMNVFRQWQKMYDKLAKQLPSVREQYETARETTICVEQIARELEQMIVQERYSGREAQKHFAELLKELKKMQNSFDHEFIVSREDKELHSTYESILRLGVKALEPLDQRLILQSEIENLLALLKENLEKEKPQFLELCFFYQEHSDRELVELPPAERLNRIAETYRKNFVTPVSGILIEGIVQADLLQVQLEQSGKRADRRMAEQLQLLWNQPGEQLSFTERARRLFGDLMELLL